MIETYDVIVVGGGLSGYMAAAKAGELGKRVLLLTEGSGCFPFLSGCIDLWGYQEDGSGQPASDPGTEIGRRLAVDPLHPYGKLRNVLDDSVNFLRDACRSGLRYTRPEGRNITVPTPLGAPRPAFLVPESMYRPGWEEAADILVAGFAEYRDFFPSLVAANLATWHPGTVRSCTVTLGLEKFVDSFTLAHLLERDPYRQAFVAQVGAQAGNVSLVLVPAVFGLGSAAELLSGLERSLGLPLMEMATLPPGVPGLRLQAALHRYVLARGARVTGNVRVTGARSADGVCLAVTADEGVRERTYEAPSFVLATGSFVSGGFAVSGNEVVEPVMHLPVFGGGDVHAWTDEPFLTRRGRAFLKAGIRVDEDLHPLDPEGRVLYSNVFVTGAKLADYDYSTEKTGTGVAVASGYKAGLLG